MGELPTEVGRFSPMWGKNPSKCTREIGSEPHKCERMKAKTEKRKE